MRSKELAAVAVAAVVLALAVVAGLVVRPGDASVSVAIESTESTDSDETDDFDEGPHGSSDFLGIPGTAIRVEPLTVADERDVGASVTDRVLASYAVADEPATQQLLDDLLVAIAPADGRQYTVTLLESEQVNAFAVIGGSIFFTTGITDLLDENELAFVMGHEIAHITCRHSARAFERDALAVVALEVVVGDESSDRWFESAEAELADALLTPGFSRRDEREADLYSLELLQQAGVSTDGAASALRVLLELDSAGPRGFDQLFSSHPPTAARIEAIERELAAG